MMFILRLFPVGGQSRSLKKLQQISIISKRRLSDNSSSDDMIKLDLTEFTTEKIRNFCIVAHIDHGKSTLADRLLELTGTITKDPNVQNKQVLDRLEVERKRGITVKAQTASMFYTSAAKNNQKYLLNLIDTPGHVDFNFEVARSLKACQGCLLVVDATQGVQAQTIGNFFLAFEAGLQIIPLINKIDMKNAKVNETIKQLSQTLDLKEEEMILISAKLGTNCESVLEEIVKRIPPPPEKNEKKPFRAFVFDSVYDNHRGAIVYVAVHDGKIERDDRILSHFTKKTYQVQEVGLARPDFVPAKRLTAGQVGYLICNMRSLKEAFVGDTLCDEKAKVDPIASFTMPKQMVFSGFFPEETDLYNLLRKAIEKLCLNDSSVSVLPDASPALGQGYRLGFLGLLHMEVFKERLEKEFNQEVIVTAPSVPYKLILSNKKQIKFHGTNELTILNPEQWPDDYDYEQALEPLVIGTIVCPNESFSEVNKLCLSRRGQFESKVDISGDRSIIKYKLPLNEIILDFYDKLKTITSGYGSFDYEDAFYEPSDLVKLKIFVNDNEVEELTQIVNEKRATQIGRRLLEKLRDEIPQRQFTIAIQAKVGGKIIARETIRALRKVVAAKFYAGDKSRKLKLLKESAESTRRQKLMSRVGVTKDVFIKVLKKE